MIGELVVEIAPGDGPFTASKTWVDVSAYVRAASTDRGRSDELDQMQAGTCSVEFDNSTRRFDPLYAAGPYFGDLTPGVPLRVSVDAGSGAVPIFTGFVHSWPQNYDVSNNLAVCQVEATDAFRILNRGSTPGSALELSYQGFAFWRLDSPGVVVNDGNGLAHGTWYKAPELAEISFPNGVSFIGTVFDGSQRATIPYQSDSPGPLDIETSCLVAEVDWDQVSDSQYLTLFEFTCEDWGSGDIGAALFLRPMWIGLQVQTAANRTVRLMYGRWGLEGAPANLYQTDVFTLPSPAFIALNETDDGFDVNGVTYTASNAGTYSDSTLLAQRANALTIGRSLTTPRPFYGKLAMVGTGGSYSDISTELLTGAKVEEILDRVGWPAADRDIATGYGYCTANSSSSSPLSDLLTVAATEQGVFFIAANGDATFKDRYYTAGLSSQATFSDDGAGIGYRDIGYDFDDVLIVNESTVESPAGGSVTSSDTASQALHGPKSETVSTLLRNGFELRALGEYRVGRFGSPQVRSRPFTLSPEALGASTYGDLLGLEIGDLFTLERTPQGVGSQIVQELVLEGISWSFPQDQDVKVTLQGSPPDPNTYAVFDTGEFDNDIFGL